MSATGLLRGGLEVVRRLPPAQFVLILLLIGGGLYFAHEQQTASERTQARHLARANEVVRHIEGVLGRRFTYAEVIAFPAEGDCDQYQQVRGVRNHLCGRHPHVRWANEEGRAATRWRWTFWGILGLTWGLAWVWFGGAQYRSGFKPHAPSSGQELSPRIPATTGEAGQEAQTPPPGVVSADTRQPSQPNETVGEVPGESDATVPGNANHGPSPDVAAVEPDGPEPGGLAPITKIRLAFWTATVLALATIIIRLSVPIEGSDPTIAVAEASVMLILAGLMLRYKSRAAAIALFILFLAGKALLIGSLLYGAVQLGTVYDLGGFFARRIMFALGMATLLWLGIEGTFALRRASRQE